MSTKSATATVEAGSSALALLAQLQQAVAAARTGKEGLGAGGLSIDRDTFERVTGSVMHESADLRRELGGRLELFNLSASALLDPLGRSWYVKLTDSVGQEVDLKVDPHQTGIIGAVIHNHAGLAEHRLQIKDPAAIGQLIKLLGTLQVRNDIKEACPLSARYLADAKRALAASVSPVRARQRDEVSRALSGAATGKITDIEKLLSLYTNTKFAFTKFKSCYNSSDNESISLDFQDKNGSSVTITCTGEYNDDGDKIINYEAKLSWSLEEETPRAKKDSRPSNEKELREWMNKFGFKDYGRTNNTDTSTGEIELTKKQEKKFAEALIRFAKRRKWDGRALTFDTSKGSIAQLMGL